MDLFQEQINYSVGEQVGSTLNVLSHKLTA